MSFSTKMKKNDETVKPSCPNFSPKLKTKNYLAAAAVVRTSYMFKHTPYNALDVDVLMHSLYFITSKFSSKSSLSFLGRR